MVRVRGIRGRGSVRTFGRHAFPTAAGRVLAAIATLLVLWPSGAAAQEPSTDCLAARSPTWTAQEAWVWEQVCARRSGDLGRAGVFGSAGNVTSSEGWSPDRALRAEFIETILTTPTFTEHLANKTVQISGAWFQEPINLEGASINHPLYFNGSRFEAAVYMREVRVAGNLGFDGAALADALLLDGAVIEGGVFLRNVAVNSFDATGAEFGGAVELTASTFQAPVDLNTADIGTNVFLNNATFAGNVDLGAVAVSGAVFADHSIFERDLLLYGSRVAAQLVLAGSEMRALVDLTAAQIGGTLALSDRNSSVSWAGAGGIRLTAATVNAIDDSALAWPSEVHLEGFRLEHAHGQGYTDRDLFIDRSVDWYLDWLRRDDGFSRGAYIQLESLLRSAGRQDEADDIGMARAGEDAAASTALKHAISPIYRYTVGYGYHPEWAVFWVTGLVLVGSLVALRLPRRHLDEKGAASRVILSAHRLIPLISFGQAYSEVDLTSRRVPWYVRWYFYLHAVLGYVLAAALVAALSGAIATG